MPSSRRPSFSATRRLGGVARHDRGFEPVQRQRLERVAHEQHDAFGHVPVAGERLVDPVADVRHLERPALHAAEAHLAREAAVGEEQPEAVRGVEVTLAFPCAAAGAERLAVERGIGAAGLGLRLPPSPATRGTGCGPRATRPSPRAGAAGARRGRRRARASARPPRSRRAWPGSSRPDRSPGGVPVATARIARRRTLALRVFGSASVKRTAAGRNDGPRCSATRARSSSRSASSAIDARAQHDEHPQRLALHVVGHADRGRLEHRGMPDEHRLDLGRARGACPRP